MILDTLTSYFQQIYGSDAYLELDSKDGQVVALVTLAIHDANNTAISVYDCFFPAIGYGTALTSNVEISGIARKEATNPTVGLVLAGTVGTTITNGTVKGTNNAIQCLPASVMISVDGTVMVTAICSNSEAAAALAGTIITINTLTRGWTSVINPTAVTVGAPTETDAELRIRQGQNVALPSVIPFEGVGGVIANVVSVTRHKLCENNTGVTDSNGLPPYPISAIADSGDVTDIAQTVRGNKGQGTAIYGTTSVTVPDTYGNPHVTNFLCSTDVPIFGYTALKAFTGYTSQIGVQIQQTVAGYINGLTIGDLVLLSRIYSPANLGAVSGGSARYHDIQELPVGKSAGIVAAVNISIACNESVSCKPENVVPTVMS